MSLHAATVDWRRRPDEKFTDSRYSRAHRIRFDGGVDVPASSSPQVVPPPWSRADAVDPEEAFVASLASCHLLWFLSIAAQAGYTVDSYVDAADGVLARDADGRLGMTVVTLRPRVRFAGSPPDEATFARLHHEAHEQCFIANSVRSDVRCEPVIEC